MSLVAVEQHQDAEMFRFDQSGALLRKVMESAAVGMMLVSEDWQMIYANRAYETMLGYEPGESLGIADADLVDSDDLPIARLHVGRLLRGEVEEFRVEARLRRKDGSPLWVVSSGSLVRNDATGRPLYVIIQIVNIDAQKRAEEALAASESRWNFALESASQGVWDHDIRKDDMFYSRMWRRMRGFADDEVIDPAQEKWLERVHPDDVPSILATVAKQDSGEDGYDTLEYRERHRNGHWIWILSRGKPVEWDAEGRALRTVGTDTDITHLKHVEEQLAEEKERLRVTLESIGDGVISTDARENIIFMNPIAEAMTGWCEQDAIGQPLAEVFVAKCESTGQRADDPVAACLASGELSRIEGDVVLASRNGAGCGVIGTAAPVRSEEGRLLGAVLVFKDNTESQEHQRQLAHSANHDPLTGLPNRAAFDRTLIDARRRAETERRTHALCFIDLDRFKPVNDTAGHAAGDSVLRQVAQVIRRSCRSQDFAARLGGDEFVLLLADCDESDARQVAEKITDAIAGLTFNWNGNRHMIGASIGIARIAPDTILRDPLAAADAACYAAKAAGRGRVMVSAA